VATPVVFRLFSDILTLIPRPPLVDAICTTIDTALRQPAETNSRDRILVPECINTAYAAQVCTPELASALCDLVVLGADYASSSLFCALRYCVDSTEFKSLTAHDSLQLMRLSEPDTTGTIRLALQRMHSQPLLAGYLALPFPKPDFPLTEECLSSTSRYMSLTPFVAFFLSDSADFDIDGTKITKIIHVSETVVVLPAVDRVCSLSPFRFTPAPQGKWQLFARLSSHLSPFPFPAASRYTTSAI
jgi:hypothetical protein